jgi:drug/metabolite transporter (DMT)-like permease
MPGVAVAACTAVVSGVSVFVSSYAVHDVASPAVYTTAKNLVALTVLAVVGSAAMAVRRRRPGAASDRFVTPGAAGAGSGNRAPGGWRSWGPGRWVGLAYVGVVGGGIAFVLFFDGLADSSAAPAAFWRDTLVLWVGVLAVPFLRERLRWWNAAAAAALVVGEVVLTGGVGRLQADRGELLVLASTVLWAVEVVVAKVLLRDVSPAAIGTVRMGVGGATLVVYLAVVGTLGNLFALDLHQVGWVVLTGGLLAVYVGTWMTALSRARALDVTSILVASAVITWLLQEIAGAATPAPRVLGLALIVAGAGTVLVLGWRSGAVGRRGVLAR